MAKSKKQTDDVVEETTEDVRPKKNNFGDKQLFEEWRMEHKFEGTEHRMEKLKLVRSNVLISQETADTLNSGAQAKDSVNPIMYFLPE